MTLFKCLAIAFFALALSACQTVPLHSYKKETQSAAAFSMPSSKENGVVRFNNYQTPKEEAGVKFLHVLAILGGSDIHYPIYASVFDVTNETRYIGTAMVDSRTLYGRWLEYEVPAGKRTFMLVSVGGSSKIVAEGIGAPHTDFIEVDVKPDSVNHIALTRNGFNRYPYFHELVIDEKYLDYCLQQLPRGSMRDQFEIIDKYMKDKGVDPNAKDYRAYCVKLAGTKYVQVPNELALKQFAEYRERIETIRKEGYVEWKSSGEKLPPYDLMRIYEPPKQTP